MGWNRSELTFSLTHSERASSQLPIYALQNSTDSGSNLCRTYASAELYLRLICRKDVGNCESRLPPLLLVLLSLQCLLETLLTDIRAICMREEERVKIAAAQTRAQTMKRNESRRAFVSLLITAASSEVSKAQALLRRPHSIKKSEFMRGA